MHRSGRSWLISQTRVTPFPHPVCSHIQFTLSGGQTTPAMRSSPGDGLLVACIASMYLLIPNTPRGEGLEIINQRDFYERRVKIEKSKLSLICTGNGTEPFQVEWLKNSRQVNETKYENGTNTDKTLWLKIRLSKEKQGRVRYTCKAHSRNETVAAETVIDFYRETVEKKVRFGEELKVTCWRREIRCPIGYKVQWKNLNQETIIKDSYHAKPAKNILENRVYSVVYTDGRTELTFKFVSDTDSGRYDCVCNKDPNDAWSQAIIYLVVTDIPFPPRFSIRGSSTESILIQQNGRLTSDCIVALNESRLSNVSISWYFHQQPVQTSCPRSDRPTQSSQYVNGSLYRRTLSVPGNRNFAGDYQCKVSSDVHTKLGLARNVTVDVLPPEPTTTAVISSSAAEETTTVPSYPTVRATSESRTVRATSESRTVRATSESLPASASTWIAAAVVVPLLCLIVASLVAIIGRRRYITNRAYFFEETAVKTVHPGVNTFHDSNIPDSDEKLKKAVLVHKHHELKKSPSCNVEFPRDRVTLGRVIGNGHFGVVTEATAVGILPGQKSTTVAVKMIKDENERTSALDLAAEANLMAKVGMHKNVVSLLGVCSLNGPLWIIVEYAKHGNLREFLRSKRLHRGIGHTDSTDSRMSTTSYKSTLTYSSSLNPLTEQDMIFYGTQVATGMEFLISKKCIHRDLAARNVLVCDNAVLKIADFGMAKDLHYFEYYKKKSGGAVPVRWTAPEALLYKVYTEASDIWSYGIVLWEIATLGGTPHPGIPVERLFSLFSNSEYQMSRPRNCPQKLYEMMKRCWEKEPENRPQFSQLAGELTELMEEFSE